MRDRKGLKDADIGLGNEKAINQLIAHHSVIFKPSQLLVWVSSDPYQEGEYICYDLNKIFNQPADFQAEIDVPEMRIAADTFLLSKEWTNFKEYGKKTDWIKIRLDMEESGFLSEPDIRHYLGLNPEYYYPHYLIGKYYLSQGMFDKAIEEFRISLKKEIPRKVDREEVEEMLEKAENDKKIAGNFHPVRSISNKIDSFKPASGSPFTQFINNCIFAP